MAVATREQAVELVTALAEVAQPERWRPTAFRVNVDIERAEEKLVVTFVRPSAEQQVFDMAPRSGGEEVRGS